jgi:TonB family protein
MKTLILPLACSALLLAVSASAQDVRNPSDRMTLAIVQTEDPIFPRSLQLTGVLSGNAKIAIDVDENGKLTDCLITGYSRKEFADSALEAIRQWRYLPPSVNGQPWASVRELSFDYTRTGVVVSFVGVEALSNRLDELLQGRYIYRTYALRELDRIPTPIQVVNPVPPAPGPDVKAQHSVTVEFFIDEQGQVRLPAVSREDAGSAYAASALVAVRQWRFDPPTVKGRPVLVLATQQFKFVPKG